MTCIVGIEEEGTVYMGGDSACSDDWSLIRLSEPKVFKIGDMLFGLCGSLRLGQVVQYGFQLPVRPKGRSDMQYLTLDVVDALRTYLQAKGTLKKENEVEELADAGFLIGYRGKLYYVDDDMQIGRVRDGYYATGSGGLVALGSLHTSSKFDLSPQERIKLALEASTEFVQSVRGPFTYMRLSSEGDFEQKRPRK